MQLRAPVFPEAAQRAAALLQHVREDEREDPAAAAAAATTAAGPSTATAAAAAAEAAAAAAEPTTWRFGPQPLQPLRRIKETAALGDALDRDRETNKQIKQRDAEQLPCALPPQSLQPAAPHSNTERRSCMRCWVAAAPLYCSSCSKFLCGACAAIIHVSPSKETHKVGTAARAQVVDIPRSKTLQLQQQQSSFSLATKPSQVRGMQCPRHANEPARYACLDCKYSLC
ncbi:hypothetical protein, conserved [Eimeria acervulina]|uniref:B box-type domain-containing protein n=1 Tax=Eimeria acervulina TaxID=5801 RepID=U6GCY0_EIMAC|nr:hypothetical protein, conserved [Eimeria acervulina]CDI76444.1 hypothetical protein, conserved [Eimeria acervulina]